MDSRFLWRMSWTGFNRLSNDAKTRKNMNPTTFDKEDVDGMINKAISTSKRTETSEKSLRWPFFIAIILIFLFEVMVRKVRENR